MTIRPHDIPDLYLAPVALHIDHQLEELTDKTTKEIDVWTAVCTNQEARTADERRDLTLRALQHLLDTHDWSVQYDARGVRLSHDEHTLVLGIPDSLRAYLDGAGLG